MAHVIIDPASDFKAFRKDEKLTTHMVSRLPRTCNKAPYSTTLPTATGPYFTNQPTVDIGDAKIELTEREKHPHKEIGYRGALTRYVHWGATFVANKIRGGEGRVYQHGNNGTRYSILHTKESQLVVYEKDKDYMLGVVIDGYFYPIYLSANGAKLYLSRTPHNSLNATLYNYVEDNYDE